MDLPHLIAEQFCISSASVLSFLENLTICFSNHGLKNTGENHRPLHQMCLLSLKCRRDPLSALISCEIGKPIIVTYLHKSEQLFENSVRVSG